MIQQLQKRIEELEKKSFAKNFQGKDECNLCKKDRKQYDGCVWYSGDMCTNLCKSCYLKWCRNNKYKLLKDKYKKAKPTTKLWYKMCNEEQKVFDKWFYANGGKDD